MASRASTWPEGWLACTCTTVVAFDCELLVGLASQAGPVAGVFRTTASACSLARVMRWRDEGKPLRGLP